MVLLDRIYKRSRYSKTERNIFCTKDKVKRCIKNTMEIQSDIKNEVTIKTINTVGRKKQTVITFPEPLNTEINFTELIKILKKQLATGGSFKNNILTLSGDHSLTVLSFFQKNAPVVNGKYKFVVNGKSV